MYAGGVRAVRADVMKNFLQGERSIHKDMRVGVATEDSYV